MASEQQSPIDGAELTKWANGYGIGLTLFQGWREFVDQVLYWSEAAKPIAAARAVMLIHERLIAIDVTSGALELWTKLTVTNSAE